MKFILSLSVMIFTLNTYSQSGLPDEDRAKARNNGERQAKQFLESKWNMLEAGENRRRSLYEGYADGKSANLSDYERRSAEREGKNQAVSVTARIKNNTNYAEETKNIVISIVKSAYRKATLSGSSAPEISSIPGNISAPRNFTTPNGFRKFVSEDTISDNYVMDEVSSYEKFLNLSALTVGDLERGNYSSKVRSLDGYDVFENWKENQNWSNYYSSYGDLAYEMRSEFKRAFESRATRYLNNRSFYYSRDYGAYNAAREVSNTKTIAIKTNLAGEAAFDASFRRSGIVDYYKQQVKELYSSTVATVVQFFQNNSVIEVNTDRMQLEGAFVPGGKMKLKLEAGAVRNIGEKRSGELVYMISTKSPYLNFSVINLDFKLDGLSQSNSMEHHAATVRDGLKVDDNVTATITLKLTEAGQKVLVHEFSKQSSLYELLALVMQGKYDADEITKMLIQEFKKSVVEKKSIYSDDNKRISKKETPKSKLGKLIYKYEETNDLAQKAILESIIHDFRADSAVQEVYSNSQYWMKSRSKYSIKKELVKFFERTVGNN